jgi:hypothetical protein
MIPDFSVADFSVAARVWKASRMGTERDFEMKPTIPSSVPQRERLFSSPSTLSMSPKFGMQLTVVTVFWIVEPCESRLR